MQNTLFIEAAFIVDANVASEGWQDASTADYYIFESAFGFVRLRKRHVYPQTFAYVKGNVLYFGYGDKERGKRVSNKALTDVPEAAFYSTEFLYAAADCSSQSVVLQRDALATLPLVVSMQNRRLYMSNKYEQIYDLCAPDGLHPDGPVIAKIARRGYPGGRTLFKEIEVIYDRQRVVLSPSTFGVVYPPHGSVVRIAKNRTGNPKEIRKRIEDTLDAYWSRYAANDDVVGSELSAGLDTSVINGYFATKKRRPFIASCIYDGQYEKQVQIRLRDFAERFNLPVYKAYLRESTDYPLVRFASAGDWQPFYHCEEPYGKAVEKLADLFAQNNIKTVFRGLGGNELCDNIPDYSVYTDHGDLAAHMLIDPKLLPPFLTEEFRQFCEACLKNAVEQPRPVPLLAMTVSAASIIGNNIYIDQDIWPVSPLADPELFLYFQSLPIEYRKHRDVVRAYMQARRFPPSLYEGPNEDFREFFDRTVPKYLRAPFYDFLEHSVLAKKGWIDVDVAKDTWERFATHGFPDDDFTVLWLYYLLTVEINLQLAQVELP